MKTERHRIEGRRARRAIRVRARITGTADRPRLSIFRSNKHIEAQLINDITGITIVAAHSKECTAKTKTEQATLVGKSIAERATKGGVKAAIADRGSYRYHGRVRALIEGARVGGLSI
jgi:large subunit ribosomal protein L18